MLKYILPIVVILLTGCDSTRSGCSVEELEIVVENKKVSAYASVQANNEIEQYNWRFSDGFEEATVQPWVDHIFTEGGNHSVNLNVGLENGNECTLEKSFVISGTTNLTDTCDIDITGWQVEEAKLKIEIDATGVESYTVYTWDYGDGTTGSGTTFMGEHSYTTAGTYLVKVGYSTFGGCSDLTQKYVTIDEAAFKCQVQFSAAPVVSGKTISLAVNASNVSNNVEYHWDMGDSKPALITSSSQYIYSYTSPGTYVVSVQVVDGACVSTANYTVEIQ